jgi:ribonuclease T
MNEREIYFSVDIEASGPIPGEYSMLSLGACLVGGC